MSAGRQSRGRRRIAACARSRRSCSQVRHPTRSRRRRSQRGVSRPGHERCSDCAPGRN